MRFSSERLLIRLFYGPNQIQYQALPIANKIQSDQIGLFSFQRLSIVTLSLPLFGFVFCIFWSLFFNFTDSTSTHCGVNNYLPSVSASIGSFAPQKYFWRSTVAVHSTPRFLVSYVYYRSLHRSKCLFTINWIEISALLGLSVVSSTESFLFHAYCFLIFILTSFFGMLLHLFQDELWSRLKLRLFCYNTCSWIFALIFYIRHNSHCETGIYTLFALAEYVFVLTNMIFHFQAYYDLKSIYFTFGDANFNTKISI
ncbi:protein kinase C-binding protein [Sarcoptes scabiei]|nr:post-GPI attachment to proteins factor 2-like protein [Sarcoptes scabiei]UXI16039.1 protein kinase C-binding protein [Sarcoptes scabiei]